MARRSKMGYIKRKSQKQEKRTAKEFGGRVTPASGALDGAKGDVRTADYLIENKFTDEEFYKLDLAIWKKIEKEALRDSLRTPVMQIDIIDLSLVVMSLNDLSDTIEEYGLKYEPDLSTMAKSIRLNKNVLEKMFDKHTFIGVQFSGGKGVTDLVVLKKQIFLDL